MLAVTPAQNLKIITSSNCPSLDITTPSHLQHHVVAITIDTTLRKSKKKRKSNKKGKINENFLVFVRVRPLLAREEEVGQMTELS